MFKVINNFLPTTVFNRLLKIVEDESFVWKYNKHSTVGQDDGKGDNLFKFSSILFNHPKLNGGFQSHPLIETFMLISDYQHSIVPFANVVKMKLNLYPNQNKNIEHAKHSDISNHGVIDTNFITSVFNFHTCNGSTVIELDDKIEKVKSKANQLIIFDNTFHYGITQSDIPRRIVLNINVLKIQKA